MGIKIAYRDDTGEVQFICPNNNCSVRARLIANLKASGISYETNGVDTFVNRLEFTSTVDIAERALAGFREVEYIVPMFYDPSGTDNIFGYIPIIPSNKKEEAKKLLKSRTSSNAEDVYKRISDLEENSKDLLDAFYYSPRPSMHS